MKKGGTPSVRHIGFTDGVPFVLYKIVTFSGMEEYYQPSYLNNFRSIEIR